MAASGNLLTWPFGDLFKTNKGSVQTTPQWLTDLQAQLGAWASKGLAGYTPGADYTGDLNFAGTPTSQEQTGLGQLTSYLGSPGTGGLFDAASNQINDTLAGKYANPATSPFIQSMTKLANQNLGDQITNERGMRGARGTYYTDAGIRSEDLLRERTLNNLNSVVGQFSQNERQNMLGAASAAQGLDQYQNQTIPLAKIGASQQYGSLSRLINQTNLESQYQDFLRKRGEQSGAVGVANSLSNNQQNITPGTLNQPIGNPGLEAILKLLPSLLAFMH